MSSAKNFVYFISIGILLLIGLSVLLLYYVQEFNEDFILYNSIDIDDVVVKYSDYNPGILESVSAEIGEVTLDNDGFFTQVYVFPKLVGCVNFAQGSVNYDDRFEIRYSQDPLGNNFDYFYRSSLNDKTEIPVGEQKDYHVIGYYYISRQEVFNQISNITIYEIPPKQNNPLGDNNYNYYYGDCSQVEQDLKPIKTIPINR